MGLRQELLIGKAQTSSRTPWPVRLTWRLCWRSQVGTVRLMCQEALSQTRTTDLPRAWALLQHQSKNWMARALRGLVLHKAQPHLLDWLVGISLKASQQPITGQRFLIGIV